MIKLFVCISVLLSSAVAIAEEDQPKESAVDKAARKFRIDSYERFRLQRATYDARRALGDQLLKDWQDSSQPKDQLDAVANWFDTARQFDELDAFPSMPEFKAEEEFVSEDAISELEVTLEPPTSPQLKDETEVEVEVKADTTESTPELEAPSTDLDSDTTDSDDSAPEA